MTDFVVRSNLNPEALFSTKHTIEFRQHISTLDKVRILSWVDFVTQLVLFASNSSMTAILVLLGSKGQLGHPNATILDVCKTIGCHPVTVKHYHEVVSNKYSKNARGKEKAMAKAASVANPKDPLADLALLNVKQERAGLNADATRWRITQKFILGGYGQYPRPFIEGTAPPFMTEEQRERITEGYYARLIPQGQGMPYATFKPYAGVLADSDGGYSEESAHSTPYVSDNERPRGRAGKKKGKLSQSVERALSRSPAPLPGHPSTQGFWLT